MYDFQFGVNVFRDCGETGHFVQLFENKVEVMKCPCFEIYSFCDRDPMNV